MTLDCEHCRDLRGRLTQLSGLATGQLGIDGEKTVSLYSLKVPVAEVIACSCPCHDTWKWANRGVA